MTVCAVAGIFQFTKIPGILIMINDELLI
ncbi:uncharacterized protein METZ01_LOCUS351337 [marine metagenome]|uniref:Uncharacterized protein n=1 Tax=marine metagenome TaxID=408172 RepID=A0A382RLB7_9ZZZZ